MSSLRLDARETGRAIRLSLERGKNLKVLVLPEKYIKYLGLGYRDAGRS